ncbi:hypothetical protein [Rhodoblastus sp.]|uniref:hypothetical protein n=1 Tax=Rhodoblastus sp. TaxID=1962975 RepID=UPI003F972668
MNQRQAAADAKRKVADAAKIIVLAASLDVAVLLKEARAGADWIVARRAAIKF